jgi:hypothetical protein
VEGSRETASTHHFFLLLREMIDITAAPLLLQQIGVTDVFFRTSNRAHAHTHAGADGHDIRGVARVERQGKKKSERRALFEAGLCFFERHRVINYVRPTDPRTNAESDWSEERQK